MTATLFSLPMLLCLPLLVLYVPTSPARYGYGEVSTNAKPLTIRLLTGSGSTTVTVCR